MCDCIFELIEIFVFFVFLNREDGKIKVRADNKEVDGWFKRGLEVRRREDFRVREADNFRRRFSGGGFILEWFRVAIFWF